MIRIGLTVGMLAVTTCAAHALAVIDDAQLAPKSDTKDKTIKLVPIQSGTKGSTDGIKCAVTTGQQGKVSDPVKPADRTEGRSRVQAYGPALPANWAPATTGSTTDQQAATGNFGRYQDAATTGDVLGGQIASEQTVAATKQVYSQQVGEIGTAKTIQGAWDQNSGVRVQNAMTWNQGATALNLYVQALNLANLMRVNGASRAATAMSLAPPAGPAGATGLRQPAACGANQIANPFAGQTGMPHCLDLMASTTGTPDEYLALIQAAARAAALAAAKGN
jgi:hypothetical protein